MQNQKENQKINQFLSIVSPTIVGQVRLMFQSTGAKIRQYGHGLEVVFLIESGKKEIRFSLQSLFLEIATINTDENQLRFDEELLDYNFFLDKMLRSARSKTKILFQLLLESNVDITTEGISQNRKLYRGFSVYESDHNKQSRDCRKYLPKVGFLTSLVKNIFRKETA